MTTVERPVGTEAVQHFAVEVHCDNERLHNFAFEIGIKPLFLNVQPKKITALGGQPEVDELEQKIMAHKKATGCKTSTISCLVLIAGEYWNVRGIRR